MRYQHFEELPCWQKAIELAVRTYALTGTGCLRGHGGLRDQLERAALSVSNNIAEGFERGTHEELLTFLYIALGSAGEVRSMLYVLEQLGELGGLREEVATLRGLAKNVSRQVNAWLESLKNSSSKGPRRQNDATRQAADRIRRRDVFLEDLRRIQEQGRAAPSPPPPDGSAPE